MAESLCYTPPRLAGEPANLASDLVHYVRLTRAPLLAVVIGIFALAYIAIPIPAAMRPLTLTGPDRPSPLRGSWPVASASIVIPGSWANDAAIEIATGDLRQMFSEVYAVSAPLTAEDVPFLYPYAILLAAPGTAPFEQLVADGVIQRSSLTADGYRIAKLNYRGQTMIAVLGGGVRGTAYGAFRLIELLRLDPDAIRRPLDLKSEPAMTFRFVSSPTGDSYPTPDQALRWGYNAVAITQWPWLVNYDALDPRLLGAAASEDRAWIAANRARAAEEIRRAKALHLQVVSSGDVLSLPKAANDLFRDEIGPFTTPPGDGPMWCLNRPKAQQFYTQALNELLTSFPDIDAIMIRTGENYPAGPIIGNPPSRKECGSDGSDMVQMVRLVMDLSYKQVVGQFGKLYIQRAWDIGDDGFHASPKVADAVLAGYANRPNMIVSFKHTSTDFWRYNTPNPNLARTDVARMVEYQSAREYEGKGAFPNYLGGLVARGPKEVSGDGSIATFSQDGIRAAWVWAKGGGWNGPYLKSDLWLDANNYALSKLIWDPALSSSVLATQWATLRFGPAAAPHIVRVLELSDDIVLRTLYVGPFARRQGQWAPNVAWTRDDAIFGGDRVGAMYQRSKDGAEFDESIAEKDTAIRLLGELAREMQAGADLATDGVLADQALNSVRYGDGLLASMSHYVSGMYQYYRWVDSGRTDDRARREAISRLQAWDANWQSYTLSLGLPYVASGYVDNGMIATIGDALVDLRP